MRGTGPWVIFVAGAGPWREIDPATTATAELLADRGFTTVVYDRVGRGESSADAPISLNRELAAITALVEAVGGSTVLCGHSSGCSLSLFAAANGVPVTGLALWEAPLAPPGSGARELADDLRVLIAAGERGRALELYMRDMPPEILEIVRAIPAMINQADSLQPDADSLAWAESAPHQPAKRAGGSLAAPVVPSGPHLPAGIPRPSRCSGQVRCFRRSSPIGGREDTLEEFICGTRSGWIPPLG